MDGFENNDIVFAHDDKPSTRLQAELLAQRLGDDDLPFGGHAGGGD